MSEKDLLDELRLCEPVAPRPELSDAICRHCTRGLRPVRSCRVRTRLTLSLAAALAVVATFFLTVPSTPQWATPALSTGGYAMGASVTMIATLLFLSLGRTTASPASRPLRRAAAFGIPLFFAVLLLRQASEWSALSEFVGSAERRAGALSCAASVCAVGVSVLGVILWIWRHTDPFTPGLSGALTGLAAGLTGCISIGVVCSLEEGWHVCVGHGLAAIMVCLIGWRVGRRLLAL